MNHEYHVTQADNISGPYDLVTIVKKIRNGSLTADMMVRRNDIPAPQPARQWPELQEFLVEGSGSKEYTRIAQRLQLGELLKNGINFLQHNPMAAIYSTIAIIIVAIMAWGVNEYTPERIRTFCEVPLIVFLYFLLSCYLLLISRMARGQPADIDQLFVKIHRADRGLLRLLLLSLFISFPVIIGIVLFISFNEFTFFSILGLFTIIVPGIYTITVYVFAPLLIVEQGYSAWKAMTTSRNIILDGGADNFSVYFSLNAINFIAGLLLLLPLVLTLPITMSAISDCYDELFT